MFVVEIVKKTGSRSRYLKDDDSLSVAKKDAVQLSRDVAELSANRIAKQLGLTRDCVVVRTKESILSRTNNKFGAVRCWWHEASKTISDSEPISESIRFDSHFEAKCYKVLRQKYPRLAIARQYPLLIKNQTKRYDRLDWKVDFRVHTDAERFNIEAKGIPLPEFKRNLQYLEFFNRDEYLRTWIVCENSQKIDKHIRALSFKEFCYKLNNNELQMRG